MSGAVPRRVAILLLPFLLCIAIRPHVPAALAWTGKTARIIPQQANVFQISLAELGYAESILLSPYSTVEYTIRLPEGWEIQEGSTFELDISYTYDSLAVTNTEGRPASLGDIVVLVDGEMRGVFPLRETRLEHTRLWVELPPHLLNDPARLSHTVKIILDAGYICGVPHRARLLIHPSTFFALNYSRRPVRTDLSLYPRPFYQRAFTPDRVRFVLPASPGQMELNSAVAVAARLGNLTYGLLISGTTDLDLIAELAADHPPSEHLIVVGRPESNHFIPALGQEAALPVAIRERRLLLASAGPTTVSPNTSLTYVLTVTNPSAETMDVLTLVDTPPYPAEVARCTPACETVGGEVRWPISPLAAGEARQFTLELRVGEAITETVLENTASLFDAAYAPINVSTLTTTVRHGAALDPGWRVASSRDSRYFFTLDGRAVPEHDGVIQEIVSPWNDRLAILLVTGLSDEAVYKASRALSSENRMPGMSGPFALVQDVRPAPASPPASPGASLLPAMTFESLGYTDRLLEGFTQDIAYYFNLPPDRRLIEDGQLHLRFRHSPLLDYHASHLDVRFNNQLVATIALSDTTARDGEYVVKLPVSMVRDGSNNVLAFRSALYALDRCAYPDTWLQISNKSELQLKYMVLEDVLDLDFYPHPFNIQPNLGDVLIVLPSQPQVWEWEESLRLAAALGDAVNGPDIAPAIVVGEAWNEIDRSQFHLIVLGRPTRNTILQSDEVRLPLTFRPGSDEIEQTLNTVVFRLSPHFSLGILELIPSPWNPKRALLAITGTTDEGVIQARRTLNEQSWGLKGNLVLVGEAQINTIDTRGLTGYGTFMAVSTAVPGYTATLTATPARLESTGLSTTTLSLTPSPTYLPSPTSRRSPAWLMPLVIGTAGTVCLIFAIAFWQSRRKD